MRTCLECHTESVADAKTCVACGGGSFPEGTDPNPTPVAQPAAAEVTTDALEGDDASPKTKRAVPKKKKDGDA